MASSVGLKVLVEILVLITKEQNSDTQLRVKINSCPPGLSISRDWQFKERNTT